MNVQRNLLDIIAEMESEAKAQGIPKARLYLSRSLLEELEKTCGLAGMEGGAFRGMKVVLSTKPGITIGS